MKYGVDPNFALAVAECESSSKGTRFRFGKVGKYWLTMGIHQCFEGRWNLRDWKVVTEVGIRALSRYKDKRKALKKYNASFDESYYKRIVYLTKKNQEEDRWE